MAVKADPSEVERKQVLILNDFYKGKDVLLFYSDKKSLTKLLRSLFDTATISTETPMIYGFPRSQDKLSWVENLESLEGFHARPVLDRKYKKIFPEDFKTYLKNVLALCSGFKSESRTKIVLDLQDTITDANIDDLISLKSDLEKSLDTRLLNIVLAFNLGSLGNGLIERLLPLGRRLVIASENDYLILSALEPGESMQQPHMEMFSKKDMEDRVKKSIDFIVYSILQNNSFCGFDVIKNIIQHFNVFLSQGTVYPILYDLSEKGYLSAEIQPDNKTRVYTVTDEGKKYFDKKMKSYIDAQERVTTFIKRHMEASS